MRLSRMLESMRSEQEIIASFGQARLLRSQDGKVELRGGTQEDHQQAKEWISMFWHEASPRGLNTRPLRG
jgi:hypothetical protein